MKIKHIVFAVALAAPFALSGCAAKNGEGKSKVAEPAPVLPAPAFTADQQAQLTAKGLEVAAVESVFQKPIYTMSEAEVDTFLRAMPVYKPDLRERVVAIGKQNLGQPYEMYLLGEAPFETYDSQPLYCLGKSDCVVYSEHTYAMALSHDWPSFFKMLQRIRYKDGEISVLTRNHYTEADWDKNNSWLIQDVTEEIAGANVKTFEEAIDRAKFFRGRYQLDVDIPKFVHKDTYIPQEVIADIQGQLRDGDFVNVVREKGGGYWVGHTGLIVIDKDSGHAMFMHSTPPRVTIQPITEYIAEHNAREARNPEKNAHLAGFKFLRLQDDPIANLKVIDGPDAPVIKPPSQTNIRRVAKVEEKQ